MNSDVSLAQEFKNTSLMHYADMAFWIMGNKNNGQQKQWTKREYYVQNNEDVENNVFRMYCTTHQFT